MTAIKDQIFKPFITSSYIRPSENQRLTEIGRVFSDPQVLARLEKMSKLARTGARVTEASRKPRNRKHELGDLIERTYRALAVHGNEPTAEQVLDALEEYDAEDIIQEIHGNQIDWRDWRGNERTMNISTLRNRLTEIRKRHSQS